MCADFVNKLIENIMWTIQVLLVTLVLLSPVACTINQNNKVMEAVVRGIDPIAARCAIVSGYDQICANYATKK